MIGIPPLCWIAFYLMIAAAVAILTICNATLIKFNALGEEVVKLSKKLDEASERGAKEHKAIEATLATIGRRLNLLDATVDEAWRYSREIYKLAQLASGKQAPSGTTDPFWWDDVQKWGCHEWPTQCSREGSDWFSHWLEDENASLR